MGCLRGSTKSQLAAWQPPTASLASPSHAWSSDTAGGTAFTESRLPSLLDWSRDLSSSLAAVGVVAPESDLLGPTFGSTQIAKAGAS